METLFDRLTPSTQAKLEELKTKNPASYSIIERTFKQTGTYLDITFEGLLELFLAGLITEITFTSVKNLFTQKLEA